MILKADQVYKIIAGAIFMAFGYLLILFLKNTYELDLVWKLVLPAELAAGFWGAVYGYPILIGRLPPPTKRTTHALTTLAILSALTGFIVFFLAFLGLASISYTCNNYAKLGKYSRFIAFRVSLNGLIVAALSFITGSIIFVLLNTPFLEIGFSGLLFLPISWLMTLGSLDYSGVWLIIPLSILASWILYFIGLYLRAKVDAD